MKVYDKGVPAHAQVFVDPEKQLVVDFLNDDGVVVNTAIYDRGDIEAIAERYGCDVKRVSSRISETDDADSVDVTETGQGADKGYKPLAEMEAEAVSARGDDEAEEPEEGGLHALTDEELYAAAQEHGIKGRTKMDRAELIDAIQTSVEDDEE